MVVIALVLVGMTATGVYRTLNPGEATGSAAADSPVLRPDSYRLSTVADGKVTMVEFVDFECEACADLNQRVEVIRRAYQDRVTFVVRFFPSETHPNAQRAARAVEAAAQQGQFTAMYTRMIESQAEWSGSPDPQDDRFRGFAADLGLDLQAWEAAYTADTTWARIQADIDDGLAAGVTSTPGFFVNGDKVTPQTPDDLIAALDQALAR